LIFYIGKRGFMKDQIYEKLREFIDAVTPWGFPPSKSRAEIEILKNFFTRDQAETIIHLKPVFESAEIIAKRIGIDPGAAAAKLNHLVDEGLIVRAPKGNSFEYKAIAFAPGFAEMKVDKLHEPENMKLFALWASDHMDYHARKRGADAFRVLPVEEAVPGDSEVLSYENSMELIEKAPRPRAAMPCLCRDRNEKMGGGSCGRVMEACISFGGYAQYIIDKGMGRELDDEDFRKLLKKTEEDGLVHLIYNTSSFEDTVWMCNCCLCCCDILSTVNRTYKGKIEGGATPSSYIAVIDPDKCSGCELCMERCQFTALTFAAGISTVKEDRCAGCGVCVGTCPEGAISLVKRKAPDIPKIPVNVEELLKRSREVKQ
jgi:Na+-translocating ferredoxin:NAD+ oxidoreductase subunit B